MTVKELMSFLKDSNPNLPVILSKDPEGNGFNTMNLMQEARFVPDKWGRVEVYNEEDSPKNAKPCVVLWP